MWNCHKCQKPVYFAERVQSMGFNFHPDCLRCQECNKKLYPGQHFEHKGLPYCHIPCYSALFGPKLFGHGTRVETHSSFGVNELSSTPVKSPLDVKLEEYNMHQESSRLKLTSRKKNGQTILEGVLKVYWDISEMIQFQEDDSKKSCSSPVPSPTPTEVTDNISLKDDASAISSSTKKKIHAATNYNSTTRSPVKYARELIFISKISDEREEKKAGTFVTPKKVYSISPQSKSPELSRKLIGIEVPSVSKASTLSPSTSMQNINNPHVMSTPKSPDGSGRDTASAISAITQKKIYTETNYDSTTRSPVKPVRQCIFESRNPDKLMEKLNLLTIPSKFSPGSPQSRSPVLSKKLFGNEIPAASKPISSPTSSHDVDTPHAIRRQKAINKMDGSRKRCSINGYVYDRDTSAFLPPVNSFGTVWVSSLIDCTTVIQILLEKYKIQSRPENFCLFVVKDNGERKKIQDNEKPLLVRVLLGPYEDVSKICICSAKQCYEVTPQMAQYYNLSFAECRGILERFYEEEEKEVMYIKSKYEPARTAIEKALEKFNS